jgi:hypothetical protein
MGESDATLTFGHKSETGFTFGGEGNARSPSGAKAKRVSLSWEKATRPSRFERRCELGFTFVGESDVHSPSGAKAKWISLS